MPPSVIKCRTPGPPQSTVRRDVSGRGMNRPRGGAPRDPDGGAVGGGTLPGGLVGGAGMAAAVILGRGMASLEAGKVKQGVDQLEQWNGIAVGRREPFAAWRGQR